MKQKQWKINNLIQKFERIKREIEGSIEYLKDFEKDDGRPRCAMCGWRNMRVRQDKTYFCASCGHDSKGDKLK